MNSVKLDPESDIFLVLAYDVYIAENLLNSQQKFSFGSYSGNVKGKIYAILGG